MFQDYIWLVETIRKAGRITLEEINQKWINNVDLSDGLAFSRSTFNRYKDAVEVIFGVIIECDRQHGFKYSILNPKVLEGNSIQNWMMSTLTVNNLVGEFKNLHERIALEPTSTSDFLPQIIEAMNNSLRITISYQKYSAIELKEHTFDPYCIKMYKRRWYVLGYFGEEKYRVFSLDRIMSLDITTEKIVMDEDFTVEDHFRECFGIV